MNAKRALNRARAPDELGAEERAWAVVRSAYAARPLVVSRRSRWRLAAVPVLVAVIAGVALSPAGATVSRLIRQALGVQHAAHSLFSLPAPGRLLISGPGGTWTVTADGSSRRLGTWRQASFSPHALYIAAARGDELAALDPRGVPRWTLSRPAVSDPTWYSPSGFRLAYLSGRQLRVVAGDGTGDHQLASKVASVAPAWRPDHPYQLAYIDDQETLLIRDAGNGQVTWTKRIAGARSLDWSADGNRLLVLSRAGARVYNGSGHLLARITTSSSAPLLDGSLSPDGTKLAVVRAGITEDVAIAKLTSREPMLHPVLSGTGLRQAVWAPDNRWLLISWPAANQWVFVHVGGAPRIAAVSRITQQFTAHSTLPGSPRLEGWCCTARGNAG